MVPERKPRTLCLCQLVACMSSTMLAPSLAFKRSRTRARFVGSIIGLLSGSEVCGIDTGFGGIRLSSAVAEIFSVFLIAEDLGLGPADLADFVIVSFFEDLFDFMLTFVIGWAPC